MSRLFTKIDEWHIPANTDGGMPLVCVLDPGSVRHD